VMAARETREPPKLEARRPRHHQDRVVALAEPRGAPQGWSEGYLQRGAARTRKERFKSVSGLGFSKQQLSEAYRIVRAPRPASISPSSTAARGSTALRTGCHPLPRLRHREGRYMSIHLGRICLAVAKVDGVVEEPAERSALRPVSDSAQPNRSMCRASAALRAVTSQSCWKNCQKNWRG
jgi:hypothetical protein